MRSAFERMAINDFFGALGKPFFIGPDFGPQDGMVEYATTLHMLGNALPGDRLSLLLAAVPLHWIQKTYTSADDDGIARLKKNPQRKYSDPDFQKVDAKMTKINAKFMIFNQILSKNRLDVYRNLDFELDGKDFPA